MTIFLLLLVILTGIAATTYAILRDDRGQLPPPSSRRVDEGFAPPSALFPR